MVGSEIEFLAKPRLRYACLLDLALTFLNCRLLKSSKVSFREISEGRCGHR